MNAASCAGGMRTMLVTSEHVHKAWWHEMLAASTPMHGTGYRDRLAKWRNGERVVLREPDPKPNNRMSKHALRTREAFHRLREMTEPCVSLDADERPRWGKRSTDEARQQAVRVVMQLLTWIHPRWTEDIREQEKERMALRRAERGETCGEWPSSRRTL